MITASTDLTGDPAAPARPSVQRAVLERLHAWQRESLVRFMGIGGVIFFCAHLLRPSSDAGLRRIVVDPSVEQRIVQLSRAQSGLTPGTEQMKNLENDYVDDEVRYREALRLGLDRDDEIVRRRLIQKVMFLQHDLATPSKPGEETLRAYYDAHAADFRSVPTLAFEQIYFSPDNDGWDGAQSRAWRSHDYAVSHPATPTIDRGDPAPVAIPSGELTREQAAALLGATPVVDALFSSSSSSTPDSWSRPVRSGYGWHLVRVTHRTDSQVPSFEQVRTRVEAAWRDAETLRNEQRELATLRSQYQVIHTQ